MSPHTAWMIFTAFIAVGAGAVTVDVFWPFDYAGRRRKLNLRARDRDWWDD